MSRQKTALWGAVLFVLLVLAGLFLIPQHVHIPEDIHSIAVTDSLGGGTTTIDDPAQVKQILSALSEVPLRFKGAFSSAKQGTLLSLCCYDAAGERLLYIQIIDEHTLVYCATDYRADLSAVLPLLNK